MKKSFIILFLFTSFGVSAKASKCSTLKTCVELVSKITNKKYIMEKDFVGSIAVKISKNHSITKENGDDFLSEVLSLNGYTRVYSNSSQWTIVQARDVRYMPTRHFIYGKDEIPNNFDHIMVSIKLKNGFLVPEISRNFRPFMSRYGRIIDVRSTGTILISDTGKNIHRLISLIKELDKKPTKSQLKAFNKERELKDKIRELKAKKCVNIENELDDIKDLLRK